jgi:hypothetical protein
LGTINILLLIDTKTMATENELAQEMEELRNAVQGLSQATDYGKINLKGFGEELFGSAKTVKKAREEFGTNLAKAGKDAAGAMGNLAKSLGKGETSFNQFDKIIDATSNALAGMAKAIPFAGEAIAAGIQATGEASKFVLDQLQETTKTFNDLATVGALTGDGMKGLQKQFLDSRMSMEGYKKTVIANSQALAQFGGIVGQGANDFTKAVGDIVASNAGVELRKLGLSADQMGEATAKYLKTQQIMGSQQKMTQEQLIRGSVAYAKEMDELAKLTGASKDKLQAEREKSLSEGKFAAAIDQLKDLGPAGEAAANQIQRFDSRLKEIDPTGSFAKGMRDTMSGNVAYSEEAKKLSSMTGGLSQDIAERLKNNQINDLQAQQELSQALKDNKVAYREHALAVGDASESNLSFAGALKISGLAGKSAAEIEEQLAKTRKGQIEGTDKLTKDTIAAQIALEGVSRDIKSLGFVLMDKAIPAVKGFADMLNKVTDLAVEKIGGGGGSRTGAGGAKFQSDVPAFAKPGGGGGGGNMGSGQGTSGLRLKLGAEAGGASSASLIDIARQIQEKLGSDLVWFSGLNDGRSSVDGKSKHSTGEALDLVLKNPDNYASAVSMIQGLSGVSLAQYERKGQRNPNGSVATGDHIHVEVPKAEFGGMLSGPKSGYQAMLHGSEAVIPLAGGRSVPVEMPAFTGSLQEQIGLLSDNNSLLSELIGLMSNNNSISSKILQASRG